MEEEVRRPMDQDALVRRLGTFSRGLGASQLGAARLVNWVAGVSKPRRGRAGTREGASRRRASRPPTSSRARAYIELRDE